MTRVRAKNDCILQHDCYYDGDVCSMALGVTSNFAGQRLPKTDDIFEALGSNDELNSHIG